MMTWSEVLDHVNVLNLSDRALFTIGMTLWHTFTFWGINLLCYICYKYNLFEKQRIQGQAFPPDDLIRESAIKILKSHFITGPIVIYFVLVPFFEWAGISLRDPLPPVSVWIRDFIISTLINDTLFYWAHRFLHLKGIYKRFHKQHHNFNTPICLASEHCHMVEDIVANLIPTVAGSVILKSHAVVLWSFISFRLWGSLNAHCGYHFEWSPFNHFPLCVEAQRHNFHHSHNQGCYGTVAWDWLMGTNKEYEEYQKAIKSGKKVASKNILKDE